MSSPRPGPPKDGGGGPSPHPPRSPLSGHLSSAVLPARWQRQTNLVAGILAAGTTVYFVLFADFGEREHCFSPIRRSLRVPLESIFKLSPEESRLKGAAIESAKKEA